MAMFVPLFRVRTVEDAWNFGLVIVATACQAFSELTVGLVGE